MGTKDLFEKTNNGCLTDTKDWRKYFSSWQLDTAKILINNKKVFAFKSDETSAQAQVLDEKKIYTVSIKKAPNKYNSDWDLSFIKCSCKKKIKTRIITGGYYEYISTCEHQAAVLLQWESIHGPWTFTETEEERDARIYRENLEHKQKLLAEQKSRESKTERSATTFFTDPGTGGYFDVFSAVKGWKTTLFAINRANKLLKDGQVEVTHTDVVYGRNNEQIMRVSAKIHDELESQETSIHLGFGEITSMKCSCRRYGYEHTLCEHELVLLQKMMDIVKKSEDGDATDKTALDFFTAMSAPTVQSRNSEQQQPLKEKTLILSPRLLNYESEVSVTFKLYRATPNTESDTTTGRLKSKPSVPKGFVIKNLKTLVQAAAEETEFELTKSQIIDFSKEDFTDESLPWLTFIQRRVSEALEVNSRLQARSYYGYNQSLKMQDSLSGALLDQFYDIAENGTYEAVNKINDQPQTIHVGHADMRVHLRSERVADRKGNFQGVLITGKMPVILPGSSEKYILGDGNLSKITKGEETVLQPFLTAADENGNIRFRVGIRSLPEFYFRIVPEFLQSRYIDFDDNCGTEAEKLLPPEPEFLFRLDLENDICTCEAFVSYNGAVRNLLSIDERANSYHDIIQENRVQSVLENYFPITNQNNSYFFREISDDFLYHVKTEIIPELSRYGEVQGSEAFNRLKIRTAPLIQVGVSIESGLMDISIISKDVSPDELLDILNSYRAKKKYHRLKSGDYIRLSQGDQLQSLDSILSEIHVNAEDIIGKEAHLPIYRALYLDAMLKKHEELAANRDKTYRTLIKNFSTIRDADFEPPKAQAETLRPYQVYGFKWLRTLTAAGFGGILADEMGLGKTIQAITLLQSLKDENLSDISLIVCPASLVYNWQEEFRRFAPQLSVDLISGTAAQRKKQLSDLSLAEKNQKPDVLITSYDLFKKDINLYNGIHFTAMFLDEAQYIKNQKAAVTKSVKAASAKYRFALTGTPVENRLAELWSIFDFLMPGFLYSYQEFSSRFETPIVKNKDQELSAQLRQMTSPFILRRLKTDVLKDLPEKLEEVRYTRFEEDQRKLYDGQVVHMKQMISGMGGSGEDKLKVLTELMRIRQICCDPSLLFEDYHGGSAKREACLDLIQSAIAGGHRMLVFSQFTSMLALLEEDLKKEDIQYLKLTGTTPKEQRIRMVREFNEGDVPVFLISLKAGGTGLNLTGADVVIHYDPWWNIAAQNQATDRAHRIGQTNTVTVYRLIVKDSIEEKILALQEAKKDLAESILSGDNISITSMSTDELLNLLG
ncbi:MAG: DEAD/DEAH box helicase [Anaerolineaceae bacterium]|nr:DEAD/DEAH box helicase [Anaerolineaceae bacterium]